MTVQQQETPPRTESMPRWRAQGGANLRSSYLALVRRLRATVTSNGHPQDQGWVLGVLSTRAGEGASTVAANLAACGAAACERPALLIDAHGARPAVSRLFEVAGRPGLRDVLTGEAELHAALKPTAVPQLCVLPWGAGDADPEASFARSRTEELWHNLRRMFDLIVLDLPPVSELGGSLPLAELSEGVLLVLKAEVTRLPATQQAKELLAGSGINILGCVLNQRRYYIPEWLYRRL